MQDNRHTPEELGELRAAHQHVRDAREAYRLNAVIPLGTGWRVREVAEALLIDPDTVRCHFQRLREGGITAFLHMNDAGREAWLNAQPWQDLDQHLRRTLYLTAAKVASYVHERWGVCYTLSGMTALLHRLGYVYKNATLEPGKHPAPEKQQAFVEKNEKLNGDRVGDEVIYFVDPVHPQHNPFMGYGWIKRSQEQTLPSHTGRQRKIINGTIKIATPSAEVRFDDTTNATSMIALFQQLEPANPTAARIIVIGDNARYYQARLVSAYLENSPIGLVPLPPYCPNHNLIERLCKFFKRRVLHNQYYETFAKFKDSCETFFAGLNLFTPQLRTLLTDNFQIIGK